ncbi:MAG: esterase-like activity of phytase family protein [Devosia sp.]
MRRGLAALAGATLLASASLADEATVTAVQLPNFQNSAVGEKTQGLIYRGGLQLTSATDTFGGLSAIGFTGPDGKLVMVSDRGNFVSGQLVYDDAGQPLSLVGVQIAPIQNSKGADLPRAFARDAEALTIIERPDGTSAVRVGFENLTRVADFHLENGVPTGAASEVVIPEWLTGTRTNDSLEAVCVAPQSSPIAGSTLLVTEGVTTGDGAHAAWLLGKNDKGPLSYRSGENSNPTDCAFMPNGDLLVLERGVSIVSFVARLVRIKAADVKPGAELTGEVLYEGAGGSLDNMEGLAVHVTPAGETRITLVSDNNFNDWERNLLLEFSLPD